MPSREEYDRFKHGKTCQALVTGYPDVRCKGCRAMLAVRRAIREGKKIAINPRTSHNMRVQSLLFNRSVFTERQATAWAHAHGFKYGHVEIPATGKYIHLRQLPPRGRVKRVISIGSTLSGIRAIVLRNPLCCP